MFGNTLVFTGVLSLGLALVWSRVLASHFAWPMWLVHAALMPLLWCVAMPMEGALWPLPTLGLLALGVATLAMQRLSLLANDHLALRRRLWWATLGVSAAVAAVLAPPLRLLAVANLAWATWATRRGASMFRWGWSASLLTLAAAGLLDFDRTWSAIVAAPPRLMPPSWRALDHLIDTLGALALGLAMLGTAVTWLRAPWAAAAVAISLIIATPAPWVAPWEASWPWGVGAMLTATIGIGWLATQPERPSHRIALWLALTLAASTYAWAPALL